MVAPQLLARQARSALVRSARKLRQYLVAQARVDVNAFCELVGRDEATGERVVQADVHKSWHGYCDAHDRLIIWAAIEHGKTSQLSVLRTLWKLGRSPNKRFLLLSNTKTQAVKVASLIKAYVENSDDLHDVFPDLQPGFPWGEQAFSVARTTHAKDFSIQTAGIHGNVQGSRIDDAVMDDMLDWENTQTQDQRKKTVEWVNSAVMGRLVDESTVLVVGTAFHPQDLLHQLARAPNWAAYRFPVLRQDGHPRWPERWPHARIAKKRLDLGPHEASRQLDCEARDDGAAVFKREWLDVALRLGEGTQLCSALMQVPRGYQTFVGVDLAVSPKETADKCCIFAIAVDPFGIRSVLSIESGRWSGMEIVQRIRSACQRYQALAVVENNAAQDFIVQFTRQIPGPAVRVMPYTTTHRAKAHPEHGVQGIAAEMASGKWKVPNQGGRMHPEVQAWFDEMLYYDPRSHTGDRLMAAFFAREGVRLYGGIGEPVTGGEFTRR